MAVLFPVSVQEAHVDVANRIADHGNGAAVTEMENEYLNEPFIMAEKQPSLPKAW